MLYAGSISIGYADAQTARFADEAEGSIAAVVASLEVGSLVALEWLQVAVRSRGAEQQHIEYPCQKLEPISTAKEAKLLAANPEVEILGLTSGMEALLRAARSQPEALAALHAAQRHPRAMQALQDVVEKGRAGIMSRSSKDEHVSALLGKLEELKLIAPAGEELAVAEEGLTSTASPLSVMTADKVAEQTAVVDVAGAA